MFKDAAQYLENYRQGRADQLNNKAQMRWFSSGVASMADLLKKFDSSTESKEWMNLHNAGKDGTDPSQALQLKMHFLAGCRRDLRMMYASRVSAIRTPVDWDRFEYMKLHFHRQKVQYIQQWVEALTNGA